MRIEIITVSTFKWVQGGSARGWQTALKAAAVITVITAAK